MSKLKLFVIALVAVNLLLMGLEASKPPAEEPAAQQAAGLQSSRMPGIRLLSELSEAGSDSLDRQCFTVGPFETRPTVDAIVEMLQQYASSVGARQTEAFVDRGFWVYLPPFEDEREARAAVDTLYDAGLDDVALIRNGIMDNSVSLGYFINQPNAIQHRDRVREIGFPAEFIMQRHDESRFWVDYEQQAGEEYASRVLAGLVPAELHRTTACPEEPTAPGTETTAP